MIPKPTLILIASILSVLVWAVYIWSINKTLNWGMGVGPEMSVAFLFILLMMLLFPSILIIAAYKCTSMFSLGVVWGLTILIYSIPPIQAEVETHEKETEFQLNNELATRINNPASSWDNFKASAEKANREMDADMLKELLDHERFDLAQKMLENGFDVHTFNVTEYLYNNYVDAERMHFSYHPQANCIRFLMENGCSCSDEFDNNNALSLTIRYQDHEASQLLWDKGIGTHSVASFVAAAEVGKLDLMRKLMENIEGASLNNQDGYGNTPLLDIISRSKDNVEAVSLLLTKGANVNKSNFDRVTPLYAAIDYGSQKEVILLLLKQGADATRTCKYGKTVLQALLQQREEDVELLTMFIQKGVDINHLDDGGYDALYQAVKSGFIASVEVLVKAGAMVTRTYPDEQTLLELANREEVPYPAIKQYLTDHGAK